MAAAYGETVLDFDLNFLHPPVDNTEINSRYEKLRKDVLIVKKKTIAVNSIIRKYCDKMNSFYQTEKLLQSSKEECKQICIDYRKSLETCTKLENDIQILQHANKQLEERCFNAENQYAAVKSHANQLQILVREHETKIEALNIESKLTKTSSKDCDKKVSSVQKENEELISHICLVRDIILGKKKLNIKHKILLRKYDKYSSKNIDAKSKDDASGDENDFYDDTPMSPFYGEDNSTEKNYEKVPISSTTCDKISGNLITKRDEVGCSSDLVSVDTGRGSSMAFSDSDKCSRSPDYFINDSPLSVNVGANKRKNNLIDVATSPIHVYESVERSTSPIIFKDNKPIQAAIKRVDVGVSTDLSSLSFITNHDSPCMVNRAVSPIQLTRNRETSTSPIRNFGREMATSPIKIIYQSKKSRKTLQEEECLELNNSNTLCDDNTSDCEIERILSTMRMHQELITPIPMTPAKPSCAETLRASSITSKSNELARDFVYPDVGLDSEGNKKIYDCMVQMIKVVETMKYIVFNKVTIQEPIQESTQELIPEPTQELIPEPTQELIPEPTQELISEPTQELIPEPTQYLHVNEESCPYDNDLIIIDPNLKNVPSSQGLSLSYPNTEINNFVFTDEVNHDQNHDDSLLDTSQNLKNCSITSPVENAPIDDHPTPIREQNNSSLGRFLFEEPAQVPKDYDIETRELTDDVDNVVECSKINSLQIAKDDHYKPVKARKLSKLDKLKKRLQPKCKIQRALPLKKICIKPKTIILPKKKKVTEADSSATLNDKTVYDKALKIMAELKSKQNIADLKQYSKRVTVNTKKNKDPVQKCLEVTKSTKTDELYDDTDEEALSKYTNISMKTKRRKKSITKPDVNIIELETRGISNSGGKKNKHDKSNDKLVVPETRKHLKRSSINEPEVPCKRILRSSTVIPPLPDHNIVKEKIPELKELQVVIYRDSTIQKCIQNDQTAMPLVKPSKDNSLVKQASVPKTTKNHIEHRQKPQSENTENVINNPKESILCVMIEKYGVKSVNYAPKKVPENTVNSVAKKIEDHIAKIIALPTKDVKIGMDRFVQDAQKYNVRSFLAGLIKYLKDPARKQELFSKVNTPPAPPMTKPEQVLLYVVTELKTRWPGVNIINKVLVNIEYTLFALNRAPPFEVIESMSHFYAVLCRYFKLKSRLRLFILDAMYCLQFKSVPLITQCIDVWMHILPLAHMGIAKSPLVTCLVYLLHFYKCDDRYNRVQDIRNILSRKYFYDVTEWTEPKILDLLRTSIKELRGIAIEKKMLRMALIIIAKRRGAWWCHNNIIKNMLLPMIEKEKVSPIAREFCVSMLGPLLKPYPIEMKVHCEVVMNLLINMLERNPTHNMAEAIMKSLITMNRHNQNRVVQALIAWRSRKTSPELEELFRDFVRSKPIKGWVTTLSRIAQYSK